MKPAMPDSVRFSITFEQLQARLADTERQLAQAEAAVREGEASRRESQDFFTKSFQTIPALMLIARLSDGKLLEANAGFERASGYTRAEVIGHSTLELNLWSDTKMRDAFVEGLRRDGRVRDFEGVFRDKHGETRHMLLNADLVEMNGTTCMLTVGVDIGERLRREQVQNATYQISRAVLAGSDLTTLFAELHRLVAGLMPAKNFYVALLNADGSMLSFPYFVDETANAPAPRQFGYGLTEYVIHTGKPLLSTADELTVLMRNDQRYIPVGQSAALWLGAPLMIDGRAIGVIAVQDYHNASAYGQEEKRLLMFVADQAAAAVYRRRSEALQRESQDYFAKSFQASPALTALIRLRETRHLTQSHKRVAPRSPSNAACSAARHSRSGARPAARHARSDSTEYAGRGAGRGKSAVVHGVTRSGSSPNSSNTARANANQVVSPAFVQW